MQKNKYVIMARSHMASLNILSLFTFSLLIILLATNLSAQEKVITTPIINSKLEGSVIDAITREPLTKVSVHIKGTTHQVSTDEDGKFSFVTGQKLPYTLQITYVGYEEKEIVVSSNYLEVLLSEKSSLLSEVVIVGYGKQRRATVTGSIATIESGELTQSPVPTISQALIGKVAGVTSRVVDGRPGAAARLQIRNLGEPLYVIDGVQSGSGQFNQLGPDDIENISVLKDASAAIYGLRASNGVILVTTKSGKLEQPNKINVNAYYGLQSLTRFPKPASAADYVRASAEADINQYGTTQWTSEEIAKWQSGTEEGYQGFDWSSYIKTNVPQKYINLNATGGSKTINYYLSASRLDQDAVFEGYNFNRTNVQSNIDAKIGNALKIGARINGKVENRKYPGLAGEDYYQPLFGIFRNLPTERPYANDNPNYPATTTNFASNNATFPLSGYNNELFRTLQTTFNLDYNFPIKGLTGSAKYTFFYNNGLEDIFNHSYDTYTYNKSADIYEITGGQQNRIRSRRNRHITDNIYNLQLNYTVQIGKHNFSALLGGEAQERLDKNFFVRAQPATNYIDLINYFNELQAVSDIADESARAGLIFRTNYDYQGKYLIEVGGRYDGSWRFPPGKRWGLFPFTSIGWRVGQESFIKNGLIGSVMDDLKIRASYGETGNEEVGVGPFAYISGYDWNAGSSMLNGELITGIAPRGIPVTNLTWVNSSVINVGLDFSLWNGKLTGQVDAFNRKLDGIPAPRYDVLLPTEMAIVPPNENLNATATRGLEAAFQHANKIGQVSYSVGVNATFARLKNLSTYKPLFGNSWDYYLNSVENRWANVSWGYEAIGQFASQEQIADYPVDIDGKNNTTLIPGDIIYKDVNNDGVIDALDTRPRGYATDQTPYINFGLQTGASYKGIDLILNFAGATMQSRGRAGIIKNPFQNSGNSPDFLFNDRWHRADIFDPQSEWIPGKYPALKKSENESNNRASNFWFTNILYMRLRDVQLGYTLPKSFLDGLHIEKVRIYLNAFNLLTFDNVKDFGVDPETEKSNGLDYPSSRVFNFGTNITF